MGYNRGGGNCARDLCLIETGCCLADAMGCGPQLGLVAPSMLRRSIRGARVSDDSGSWMLRVLLGMIRLYQSEISPKRRPVCRFSPTCSHYALQALETHGTGRGSWLAMRRLIRCRPGARGGLDPVPGR